MQDKTSRRSTSRRPRNATSAQSHPTEHAEGAQALDRIRTSLANGAYQRRRVASAADQSYEDVLRGYRRDTELVNVLRCLLIAMAADKTAGIAEAQIASLSRADGWPYARLDPSAINRFCSKHTRRPQLAAFKSLLFFLFLMHRERHPVTQRDIIMALFKALPEKRIFEEILNAGQKGLFMSRQRGLDLYSFLRLSPDNSVLSDCLDTKLFEDFDAIDGDDPIELTAVRLSARGPRGQSGFTINFTKVARDFGQDLKGAGPQLLHLFTETQNRNIREIRSSGFIVPNRAKDLYFVQSQVNTGGLNITVLPNSQLDMPEGFARGLILTYDAKDGEGPMITRIAILWGSSSQPMVNDCSWIDTKRFLESINGVAVSFDKLIEYLTQVTVEIHAVSPMDPDEEAVSYHPEDFLRELRELPNEESYDEAMPAFRLVRPLLARQAD